MHSTGGSVVDIRFVKLATLYTIMQNMEIHFYPIWDIFCFNILNIKAPMFQSTFMLKFHDKHIDIDVIF